MISEVREGDFQVAALYQVVTVVCERVRESADVKALLGVLSEETGLRRAGRLHSL